MVHEWMTIFNILTLYLMVSVTQYAQNYVGIMDECLAGIMCSSLPGLHSINIFLHFVHFSVSYLGTVLFTWHVCSAAFYVNFLTVGVISDGQIS